MEIKLGHKIEKGYDVHHKDGDFTNDNLDNLELIEEHKHKSEHARKNIDDIEFICPECGKIFMANADRQRDIRHNQGSEKKAGPFCSKSCAGRYSRRIQLSNL